MNQTNSKKVIVIGAGPAGLTTAYKLAQAGVEVDLYEASSHVGGMSRSFELFGQQVDCGPHRFFSNQKLINDLFHELVEEDYTMVNRLTRIYYKKRFFNYPLKIGNVLRNLGLIDITNILFSYVKQRLFPIKNPSNFEDWVTNRFGKKLYNIFFKNYTEKLWGVPCSNISADWAAQRIKGLSLFEAVKSALLGNKGNKHKTLVDQFAYPKGGTGTIYQRAVEKIEAMGGRVHLKQAVRKILTNDKKEAVGVELVTGEQLKSNYVVSTMPLTSMVKGLGQLPEKVSTACEKLYFRNTILVYLEVDSTELFSDNWVYIHDQSVKHGRITNFRNWCPSLYGDKKTSILCLEYWAFQEDEIWKADDKTLTALAIKEVQTTGLVPEGVAILNSHTMRIPKCYPVYEIGYEQHLNEVVSFLKDYKNLIPIGRYGSFKYNNQDHSILMGLLAAQQIIENASPNLWDINTDTVYQEDAKIEDVLNR
ncbi:MAG: FAD-dependent oxidoreductase [Aureispira sp.]|nr:FAD-dependent oxidoreductase [Aureispira sp.]